AIEELSGKILVISGAGSGKTRIITYGVAKLLEEGVNPNEIMLVTFTNNAAKEMIKRIEKKILGYRPRGLLHGTFHHISNGILKEIGIVLNLVKKDYTIINDGDSKDLIKICVRDACLKEIETNFDNSKQEIDEDKILKDLIKSYPKPSELYKILSLAANCNEKLTQLVKDRFPKFNNESYLDTIKNIQKRYEDKKNQNNFVDFDDLLLLWNEVLDSEFGKERLSQYKYIFIDEYQDINFIQGEIIRKLGKLKNNKLIFAVGDDAQSIYSFRGANVSIMLNFPDIFKDCKICEIIKNYRSTPAILEFANDSISKNKNQFSKKMKPHKKNREKQDIQPVLITSSNDDTQCEFIANKILELKNSKCSINKIAVLVRSKRSFYKIENEFRKKGIPYELRGGRSFFEKAHIRDICSFLRVLHNPRDDFPEIAWIRMVTYIPKLGSVNAKKIYDEIILKKDNPLSLLRNERSLKREIIDLKNRKIISRFSSSSIKILSELIDKLLSLKSESVGDMIQKFFNFKIIKDLFESKYNRDDNYSERLENIELLISIGRDFNSIKDFLNHLKLHQSDFSNRGRINKDKERIIISTVHSAKGLEWKIVFMPYLIDGTFPDFRSVNTQAQLEEERRVFYVGITRTKELLYLLFPKSTNYKKVKKSRFIKELNSLYYTKKDY
ncbi:MAG: ATP-dependent helicase, partial [Promethearchaeota archaeon]